MKHTGSCFCGAVEVQVTGAPEGMGNFSDMLQDMPSLILTADGVNRVSHGQELRPFDHEPSAPSPQPFVRLVNARGELLAIAEPTASGALHPSVVLM